MRARTLYERNKPKKEKKETHTNAPFDAPIKLICYATNIANGMAINDYKHW